MANAIMAIVGKMKKKPNFDKSSDDSDPGSNSDSDEESSESSSASEDEVKAARVLRNAKSDEEYARALKAFIKLCEGY